MVCGSKILMILSTPFPLLIHPRRPSTARRLLYRSRSLLSSLSAPSAPLSSYPSPLHLQNRPQFHSQAQETDGHVPVTASVFPAGPTRGDSSGFYRGFESMPEWAKLVGNLREGGYYFSEGRKMEEEDSFSGKIEGLPEMFVRDSEAFISFARDRAGALRFLPKKNIEIIVDKVSPLLFEYGQRSMKRLKLFLEGDESNVLVSERAQTVDIMRYVLSYACNLLLSSSDRISDINTVLVEESVRSVLAELVNITSFQAPKFTGSTSRQVPSGHEQFSRSPKQDIEMKKGDWICPKCSFMNFARNTRCLECEEARPKKQLTGREWECPQCEFHNYGKNMSCLRCDCKRPGEISSGGNTDKSEIEPKLAANDEKAERWFGKVSQLGNSADMTSSVADEDFPEIMPMRKGVNRFVVSTRKTPLERRLAASSQSGVLGGTGSDTQPSESSINRSLDRILGRSSTLPVTGEAADRGAESRLRETILSKTDPGYVPFVPLPPDMFKKPQNSTNDVQHKDDTVPTKADSPNDFLTKSSANSIGDENNNGSLDSDLTSAVPDEDFPEIMPIRKGENRFVVSKKKDRSLTSPQYKRRLAMEQSNKTDFVPFVPFPPDYFAKKDKQPEVAPVHTEKAVSESSSAPEKFEPAPERLQNNLGTSSWAPMGNQPQQHESRSYRQHESNPYNQSTNAQFSESNLNDRRVDNSSGIARTGSAFNSERGSYAPQTESSQNTRQSWKQQSFSGKSLEGSAVTEPDPLDMSEEAKAARWFRRAAQIKDISELSAIPDEDFPEIMPMRKGVNRFVVSKRKTPLERRLTSPQYRRNLPIVSSEPDKGAS